MKRLVAGLEAIRLLLSFVSFISIRLYQMDVKCAYLNGYLEEDVHVEQSPGFEDSKKPDHVYELRNAFYALKNALSSWYEKLC